MNNIKYTVERVQIKITRSSADADKPAPARRVHRSVKVTKHSTNPVSYCAIVPLSLRRVFTIFDFKNAVTLKTELAIRQGHWKCHRVIERI